MMLAKQLVEDDFKDAAKMALDGNESGAITALCGLFAAATTGHPLLGAVVSGGLDLAIRGTADRATRRLQDAEQKYDSEQEHVRALARELRAEMVPLLANHVEELDAASTERFLQIITYIERTVATSESQSQLRQELQKLATRVSALMPKVAHDRDTAIARAIRRQCDHWFRSANKFEFHPRDQFVTVHGIRHPIDTDEVLDLIDTLERGIDRNPQTRAIILANYGQGKTFFAWGLALRLLDWKRKVLFPLVYPLRNYATNGSLSPLEQILTYFDRMLETNTSDLFDTRPCVLILDGLDEIPTSRHEEVLDRLLADIGRRPNLSILITSRSGVFADKFSTLNIAFPDFELYQLAQWAPGGIQWQLLLQLCEKTRYATFAGGWNSFHNKVASTNLLDLTKRPLWCRMIIDCRESIAAADVQDEAGLYEHYVQQYLNDYHKHVRESALLFVPQILEILELLAEAITTGSMNKLGDKELTTVLQRHMSLPPSPALEAFRAELRTHSLLNTVEFRGEVLLEFGHASFKEFFFARRTRSILSCMLQTGEYSSALESSLLALEHLAEARAFLAGMLRADAKLRGRLGNHMKLPPSSTFHAWKHPKEARRCLVRCWVEASTSPGDLIDMQRFRLDGLVMNGFALSRCDLRGANLTNTKLIKADVSHSNLTDAICIGADLTGAMLVKTILPTTGLTDATMTDAIGVGTDFTDAKPEGTTYVGTEAISNASDPESSSPTTSRRSDGGGGCERN
jgi:hypothetical protein